MLEETNYIFDIQIIQKVFKKSLHKSLEIKKIQKSFVVCLTSTTDQQMAQNVGDSSMLLNNFSKNYWKIIQKKAILEVSCLVESLITIFCQQWTV